MAIMNPSKLRDVLELLPYCNQSTSKQKAIEAIITKYLSGEIVPVVRCKDCKHYSKDGNWCHRNSHFDDDVYSMNWNDFGDDDFCSYGERKTDA